MDTKRTAKSKIPEPPVEPTLNWVSVYRCKDCDTCFEIRGDFGGEKPVDIEQIGKGAVEISGADGKHKILLPTSALHSHDKGVGIAELIYFNERIEA
jgi:hypothetical protein